VGWVTLENMSGKDFDNANVKLMAGDVARVTPGAENFAVSGMMARDEAGGRPAVTERTFEEYHLYTLARPTAVLDREVKQVEFVRAANVPASRVYVYDGFKLDQRYRGWDYQAIRSQPEYGTTSNPSVGDARVPELRERPSGHAASQRQSETLPARCGRQETNSLAKIKSTTPRKTKPFGLYTGNAFDIVGERRQTSFKLDSNNPLAG
jgi:hypothetical protein